MSAELLDMWTPSSAPTPSASAGTLQAARETVRRLAAAIESRDTETAFHTERVSGICFVVARTLGLDRARCSLIRNASALHDIGKIALPDEILLSTGPLSPEQWEQMAAHAATGHDILSGSDSELLELAAVIARSHHERFDGTGYPQALAGAAIPLEGRIAAVADVFDAITHDRSYRSAMTLQEALTTMRGLSGTQFDPSVLDAFFASLDEILAGTRQAERSQRGRSSCQFAA